MTAGTLNGRAPRTCRTLDVATRSWPPPTCASAWASPPSAALPPVTEWAERGLFVGDTCHIDVIDRHGNMVAATPSGGWLVVEPDDPSLGLLR